jgi:dienelactone hydrolase
MKKILLVIMIIVLSAAGVFYVFKGAVTTRIVTPLVNEQQEILRPLEKYTFDSLKKTNFPSGKIIIGDVTKDDPDFTSRLFYFYDGSKKVSGLINIPKKEGAYPIIVMYRGYIDKDSFTSGEGTRATGEAFAKAGFITLAPDFLGFGQSDDPSEDPFENRFQTYTTALSLLASLPNLNAGLSDASVEQHADGGHIGIWGHSNGGHISLAVLAISGKTYPTVLWAPVSKSFPYSILYYTDESDDQGKGLRKALAIFEKTYDTDKFSVTRYLSWIKAPLQIDQGTGDQEVPLWWSDELQKSLTDNGLDVTYYTYPGENHNFTNGSWGLAVARGVTFYTDEFSKASEGATLQ